MGRTLFVVLTPTRLIKTTSDSLKAQTLFIVLVSSVRS
jgi:hypothetical protein